MSDKEKGLPSLRKTPVDFLSPEEARQASPSEPVRTKSTAKTTVAPSATRRATACREGRLGGRRRCSSYAIVVMPQHSRSGRRPNRRLPCEPGCG